MKRRVAIAFAIAGVVLAMQAPAPAGNPVEKTLCAVFGLGPADVKAMLENLGPNNQIYLRVVSGIPECTHAP